MIGWVRLHRKLIEWEWFQDHNTFRLFIYIMLSANRQDKTWKGMEIKEGSFVTSVKSLSEETGLTNQNVRTSLKKLQKTKELTIKPTTKYSIISVVKWQEYQRESTQLTNNQQTTNKQLTNNLTTTKEVKKERKKEYIYTENFQTFWNAYPNKQGEQATSKAYEKLLTAKQATPEQMQTAAEGYSREMKAKKKDPEYFYKGFNFINKGFWKDYAFAKPKTNGARKPPQKIEIQADY